MWEERRDEEGCGTERGRRPSGVPQPDAVPTGPVPDPAGALSDPPALEPTAEESSGDLPALTADGPVPEEAAPRWRPPLSGRRSGGPRGARGGERSPAATTAALLILASAPLGSDQLCYSKDASGWKIAGYVGDGAQQ